MTVDTITWIDAWGVTIRSPVTAGTNLILAVQCVYCALLLRGAGSARREGWAWFFAAMALATLAGVPKHGLAHVLDDGVMAWLLWTSNLASGAAVYFAQKATIASRASSRARAVLDRVIGVQATLFLAANAALGPEILLVIAHSAVGLIPVIAAEAMALRRHDERGGWVASGLVVSLLTGLVYVFHLSLGRWFNHVDMAHALMGVSFFLILRGVPDTTRARSNDRWAWEAAYTHPVFPTTPAVVGGVEGSA